ncbi:hypothetical protein PHMEG_00017661 [Phytophthora megakarya]|uniref:Uncharacterized protein n=1 Tax=Phytophthora megakarya TaxID=4795 RepID=A0A225VXB6_9STRA|nr:hypothetical protein PHMEG_00017661 [Phytophthora megakarya]
MPKSAHTVENAAVEDHAAMKKQWQTNLEIDLLKSAWIRKDREQHGAHTSPPLSAGNRTCPSFEPSDAKTMPPKPATKDAEDAQKQRQTNLEIDLLKSAWIQKDRESPPVTGKK